MTLRHILLLLLLAWAASFSVASAQEFVWELDFDFRFDNREYGDMKVPSQTLFAVRLTPAVGVGWGEGHAIVAGADLFKRFGDDRFAEEPQLVLYYRYDAPNLRAAAGIFPRSRVIGAYSRAIFSDSVRFFDNNLDGALVQYVGLSGYFEAAIDWDGMQSSSEREKFRLFSSGRWNRRAFFAGYAFSMYHFAGSSDVRGVVDNITLNPYVGLDFSGLLPFDRFEVQAGWLQSMQRDRITGEKGVRPGGAEIDLRIEKWNFGLRNTLYIGDNLLPYFQRYGGELYADEPFYASFGDAYNRTELYYGRTWGHRVPITLHAGFVMQYDGRKMGTQQVVGLRVNLNKTRMRTSAGR